MKKIYYIFLLVTFFNTVNSGQRLTDSLDFFFSKSSPGFLNTKYDKLLNIHTLSNLFKITQSNGNLSFTLNDIFNSTVVNSTDKNIRDENYFVFKGEYNLLSFISPGVYANNTILSDDRKIEINKASVSNAALYFNITPEDGINIIPFGGYSNNRQILQNDYGMLYGIEALAGNLQFGNTFLGSNFKFRNEDIFPRRNLTRNAILTVTNNFDDIILNSIGIKYANGRKDYYYAAEQTIKDAYNIQNNIQSRTEISYLAEDKLSYNNFLDIFHLDAAGRINFRSIDRDTRYKPLEVNSSTSFDTKIEELKLEFESSVSYMSDVFNGAIRINYSERDEKHQTKNFLSASNIYFDDKSKVEAIKNNNSLFGAIAFIGNLNLTSKDRFLFSFYQNKLRYDTPSLENYDDRDEVLSMGRIRYIRSLTPFLEMFINLEATQNHIVYISSQTSSNNNINRVLRLASGGSYNGRNVSSFNSFEVSANYTVYDFADINPNYRSFSFRQFTALDSSTVKLDRSFFISFYGYLKLSEQGELKWASFTTHPTRYLTELYSEPRLNYVFEEFVISGGLKIFQLNTFLYNRALKTPDTKYLSIGPVSEITYNTQKLNIRLYAWYEFISGNSSNYRQQANLSFQTNWYF